MIVLILHLVGAGRTEGVAIQANHFFKLARRSGLWPQADGVDRSAVSKQRRKVGWIVFRDILAKAVALAYELWPTQATWHGFSVLAIDGSKFVLPATERIRQRFDPESGLEHPGKGHYPQALVSTLYDVFRRLPISRWVDPIAGSERHAALELLPHAPRNSLVVFDRGYFSFDLLRYLVETFRGHFLMRCPTESTFPAVTAFARSGLPEAILTIQPSYDGLRRAKRQGLGPLTPIEVRAIRMVSPDGTVSALLTDLLDAQKYPADTIRALYGKRWEVETYYRDEKIVLDLERFHGRTVNSVLQELFAATIVTVIARTLAALSEQKHNHDPGTCQAKNAVIALAHEAALLAPEHPDVAVAVFQELLDQMARVRYYRPKTPRPPQPRVSKQSNNKWRRGKTAKSRGS